MGSAMDLVGFTHVVLDGSLSDAAVAFWADALGGAAPGHPAPRPRGADRAAEATRLVALGATRLATGRGWIVLQDPDGQTFCATGQPPEAP
jgi:glyoxalase superfamily protein